MATKKIFFNLKHQPSSVHHHERQMLFFIMRKSFILHIDSLEILNELNDEQKGKLFEAIMQYHLGNNVELDLLTKVAFAPFKNQFERDNDKYLKIVERNKTNGAKGGRPKKAKESKDNPKNPNGLSENPNKPKKADNDNDSKSDNDNKNVSNNNISKEAIFKKNLTPYEKKYSTELLKDFYLYWTEKNTNGKKMRFEMQKTFDISRRLAKWHKNEMEWKKEKNHAPKKEKRQTLENINYEN